MSGWYLVLMVSLVWRFLQSCVTAPSIYARWIVKCSLVSRVAGQRHVFNRVFLQEPPLRERSVSSPSDMVCFDSRKLSMNVGDTIWGSPAVFAVFTSCTRGTFALTPNKQSCVPMLSHNKWTVVLQTSYKLIWDLKRSQNKGGANRVKILCS